MFDVLIDTLSIQNEMGRIRSKRITTFFQTIKNDSTVIFLVVELLQINAIIDPIKSVTKIAKHRRKFIICNDIRCMDSKVSMQSFASLAILDECDPLKLLRVRTHCAFFEFPHTTLHQFVTCVIRNIPIDPFAHTLSVVFALFECHRCKAVWSNFVIQPLSDL